MLIGTVGLAQNPCAGFQERAIDLWVTDSVSSESFLRKLVSFAGLSGVMGISQMDLLWSCPGKARFVLHFQIEDN